MKTVVQWFCNYLKLLDIDLIFLQEAGDLLSFEILNTGKIIFERDREANRSFRGTRLVQCLDFKFLEERNAKGNDSSHGRGR